MKKSRWKKEIRNEQYSGSPFQICQSGVNCVEPLPAPGPGELICQVQVCKKSA